MKVLVDLAECAFLAHVDGAECAHALFEFPCAVLDQVVVVLEPRDLGLEQVPHLDRFHRENLQRRTDREHLHVAKLNRVHTLHTVQLGPENFLRLLH